MKKVTLPFRETNQFSSLVDDYLSGDQKLVPFYLYPPDVTSFGKAIEKRSDFKINREVLKEALLRQYGSVLDDRSNESQKVTANINSITSADTFTVTTGHQLNIFTGPLYAIYKIATTIKLATELGKAHPGRKFVPVFWMASEDHDFEEINSVRIYGKTYTWEAKSGGPVGRLPVDGLPELLNQIKTAAGSDHELFNLLDRAYRSSSNLAGATRKIIHGLFGKYGLVVVDGHCPLLKGLFKKEMQAEIENQTSFHAISKSNLVFSENYKIQVQPREVNLFYMTDSLRERILPHSDGSFSINNTTLKFSKEELLNLLHDDPLKFSPNVVMRPLYQEKVLPDLAYIGGPGELNYWLQFMSAFNAYHIPFPVLMLRNCMMYIDKSTFARMLKLGISVNELYKSSEFLILKILEDSVDIHPGTDKQAMVIQKIYHELANEYSKLDPSLVPSVESEKQKAMNGLNNLEEKARRALKKKNETIVNQLQNLKEKLFPGGGLQERTDNFIPFSVGFEGDFIDEIVMQADPFTKDFINLIEE